MAIKPPRLKEGDLVGVFSPSAFIGDSLRPQFNRGVEFLESLGLRVRVGKNAFCRCGESAGTARERIDDLHDLFAAKEVKAIIQSQGGGTARELLPLIDWDLIRRNPKLFGGMSDGTHLLYGVHAKTGVVTLHGPDLIWGYGRGCSDYEKTGLEKFLFTGEVGEIRPDPDHKAPAHSCNSSQGWKCWRHGTAFGPLIGGNIWVTRALCRSEYMPALAGAILFLEGIGADVVALARDFGELRQQGVFENISGVILGYFDDNKAPNPDQNRPVGEVFLEAMGDRPIPVMEIGEIGHNTGNVNLPIGIQAHLDADNLRFSIDEVALSE